ncbi:unnamed protein product [Spirodela intermedia]|uniref:DNA/RNA-binding protein Kin17 WH-like domain-containing protein n=1 Tax=Spirodela intermedia TaxID=51605 RepID=A0A7I8IX60_SPIIN|nr:unnamed protein product [Spirodela intermedia]CAA6661751.1 unnamed protein product [Spirodela intermedia]
MGKNDFLTPKAIANRIKCQKQCRDENGFKCHCMSESHQRQMQVFGQNPTRIVDGYSEEFETSFIDHVRRAHRFSRVAATVVYNEYIADRHHVHMNSTRWATLTEFVKHLGRIGKCKVEETPKGWFMTYIDRDSETIFKDRLKNKRLTADLVEEEKQERLIARQIERAMSAQQQSSGTVASPAPSSDSPAFQLQDNPEGSSTSAAASGKIAFSLLERQRSQPPAVACLQLRFWQMTLSCNSGTSWINWMGRRSASEQRRAVETATERSNRKDYWLCEGIVVKVMSRALADKGYYKQKGVVVKVIDKYVGEIEMLEKQHILRIDQEELETVIPQIGGLVRILLSVNTDKFCAKVQIEKGIYDGRVLSAVDYEDICKISQ